MKAYWVHGKKGSAFEDCSSLVIAESPTEAKQLADLGQDKAEIDQLYARREPKADFLNRGKAEEIDRCRDEIAEQLAKAGIRCGNDACDLRCTCFMAGKKTP